MVISEEFYNEASVLADAEINELLDDLEVTRYISMTFDYYIREIMKKQSPEATRVITEFLESLFTSGYIDGVMSVIVSERTNALSFGHEAFNKPFGKLKDFAYQVALHMFDIENKEENYPLASRLDDTALKQLESNIQNLDDVRLKNMDKVKEGVYLCGFHCAYISQQKKYNRPYKREGLLAPTDDIYFMSPDLNASVDYYDNGFERWTVSLSPIHPSISSFEPAVEQIGTMIIHYEDVNQMDRVVEESPLFDGVENKYLKHDRICVDLSINKLYVKDINGLCVDIIKNIAERNRIEQGFVNITTHLTDEKPKFKTIANA